MICFNGKGVSKGYGIGTLKFINNEVSLTEAGNLSVEDSLLYFEHARDKAVAFLNSLAVRLKSNGDDDAALLMEAHSELAQDIDFCEAVSAKITDNSLPPQKAVLDAGEEFALLFEQTEIDEMKLRAADIRDVAKKIADIISGKDTVELTDEPIIIFSDDISPSLIASVDKSKLLAIVTRKGSELCHAAILARCFGIPMVVGVDGAFSAEYDKVRAVVDGETGKIIIEPNDEVTKHYEKLIEKMQADAMELEAFRGKPNKTSTGKEIKLYCNVQSPEEIKSVFDNDANGIGLFRSEFLFLSRNNPPSEEEQFEIYADILKRMHGNEVIIRTVDIGADKGVEYLCTSREKNPALGIRGIRLCFEKIDIFKAQLRALYRASVYGKLLIMFPMIADLWEIKKIKEIFGEVVEELKSKGIPVAEHIPLGIMIETPAAALISDVLAKEVDFFSCGTNDLIQYTLACDRTAENATEYYNPHHLAIKRLLEMTVKNAHDCGIWVGICGEMASDASFTKELVLMGVDELSVTPSNVLSIRKQISKV